MFRWLNSRKGQNTAEYAILIGVIVAAAIAMQIYIRRGMQARIKDAVDQEIGSQGSSVQVLAPDQHQQSRSVSETLSQDTTRVVKNFGEAQYDINSTVTSTGVSNTINNALK